MASTSGTSQAWRAKRRAAGTWMKRLSASKGTGGSCIEPLMAMAMCWIGGSSEKQDMEAAKRFDLRRLSTSLATAQNE